MPNDPWKHVICAECWLELVGTMFTFKRSNEIKQCCYCGRKIRDWTTRTDDPELVKCGGTKWNHKE